MGGYITGLRFFKGAGNDGPHVGHLWTNTGTQLALAVFTNETATGWQRVSLATPVPIEANTTYVASYHTQSGNYAITRPGFAPTGHLNPPLQALADGQDGANGVFIKVGTPGAFPNETFESTNYWVDVEFNTTLADTEPVAVADSYSVNEDATLSVPQPGVLANDTDPDPGTTLSAQLVSTTAHGSLSLNADGSFSYTPQADFTGTDSFTYTASDGASSSNAVTVTITVNPVNDAPMAAADVYATPEDVPLVVGAPGVLGNDTDIDGPALSAAVVTPAANGTVVLNANGSFTYTPNANFNGVDSFTNRASDGTALSNTSAVTITISAVNDPAVVNAGTDQSITLPAAATLAGVVTDDPVRSPPCGKSQRSRNGDVRQPERRVDDGDVLRLRHLRAFADRQRRPVRQQRQRRDHRESGQCRHPLRRRERLRDVRPRGGHGGDGRDDVHDRDVVQA